MKLQVELYGGQIEDVKNIQLGYRKESVSVSRETIKKLLLNKNNSIKNRFVFTHHTKTIDCFDTTHVNGQSIVEKLYVDGHEITNLISNLSHLIRTGQIEWTGKDFLLTDKYRGAVNNSSNKYWTNESASKQAVLANYIGILEIE